MNAISPIATDKQVSETTKMALTETVLSPRFYTTDFDAMDKMDISAVQGRVGRADGRI